MRNHKLKEIVITEDIQRAVEQYNIPGGWEKNELCVASFKEEIKGKLTANQDGKCAYCGLPLSSRNPEIDHIAPKGGSRRYYYPECTFLPINLVYACHHCNSSGCKGQKNTVESKNETTDYKQWSFKLVHPYLDDPAEYFELDEDGNVLSLPKINADVSKKQKAEYTIEMFGLNTEPVLTELAKQIFLERHPDKIRDLITEISTYRP